MITNLVGNALKFTETGRVDVEIAGSVVSAGFELQMSVRDTGIGVSEHRQEIFSAFTQADLSITRRFGGTGLGLHIGSQLAQIMGGRLWMESVEGEGSTFHMSTGLEISSAVPAPQVEEQVRQKSVETSRRLRALLVEDNPMNRMVT